MNKRIYTMRVVATTDSKYNPVDEVRKALKAEVANEQSNLQKVTVIKTSSEEKHQ